LSPQASTSHSTPPSNVNHYYSSGPQIARMSNISRSQVSELQPVLQVTSTYFYDCALISTKSLSLASPESAQSSPSQDLPWQEKELLRYIYRRRQDMADTICPERGAMRRMERDCQHIVGIVGSSSLLTSESPTVLYNHNLVLRYVFMRK
jgi:hypothetical protein